MNIFAHKGLFLTANSAAGEFFLAFFDENASFLIVFSAAGEIFFGLFWPAGKNRVWRVDDVTSSIVSKFSPPP